MSGRRGGARNRAGAASLPSVTLASHRWRRALAAAAAVLALCASTSAQPARAATSAQPLAFQSLTQLDARMVQASFVDPANRWPMPVVHVRILLPDGYATSGLTYPVLYLLHGAGDTAASWSSNDDGQESLEQFTAGQRVVIVMPDGGANDIAGWYSDWFNGGAFGPPQWESFHAGELIDWVQSNYRVRTDRGGRVVAGLSMGGFGAFSYAARHPDLFAAAFSFSGFLDTSAIPYAEPAALDALHSRNGTPTAAIWGTWQDDEVRWRGHNPADLVGNLHDVPLWMATGQGVPGGPAPDDGDAAGLATESAIYGTNQTFDTKATLAGVHPSFNPYPMGGHNWWHWQNDLHNAWPLIMQAFSTPHAAPASFDYESVEPSFDAWGWSATAHRDTTEFLQMQHAGVRGLTLVGSGSVDLVTPPSYTPNRHYAVRVSGSTASTATPVAVADGSGRLHIAVTLGPSHTLQQYTAQERVAETGDPAYWETATVSIGPPHGGSSTGGTALAPLSATSADVTSLPNTAARAAGGGAVAAALGIAAAAVLARRRRRRNGADG